MAEKTLTEGGGRVWDKETKDGVGMGVGGRWGTDFCNWWLNPVARQFYKKVHSLNQLPEKSDSGEAEQNQPNRKKGNENSETTGPNLAS